MTLQQRRLLAAVLGIVFIGCVIAMIVLATRQAPLADDTVRDKDTGEIISLVNTDTELSSNSAGSEYTFTTPIVGLIDFIKAIEGNTGLYTDSVRPALQEYANNYLNKKYSTITIRPQTTKVENGVITGTIRLGQTDEIEAFTMTPSSTKKSMVLRIKNPNKGDYVYISNLKYDGMLYSIDYKNTYSVDDPNIVITVDASSTYREAAIDYIRTLGFNPGDFTITFTNYENPFE